MKPKIRIPREFRAIKISVRLKGIKFLIEITFSVNTKISEKKSEE